MTLTSACTPRVVITGNSTLGPYSLVDSSSVAIRLVSTGHLKLTRYAASTDDNNDGTLLVLNTDYTVGGTQDARTFTLIGSQAVLTSAQRIVAERVQSYTQDLDLTTGGSFNSSSLESRFDKLAEFQQELKARLDRVPVLQYADTTANVAFPSPPTSATQFLARNTSGEIIYATAANLDVDVALGSGWPTILGTTPPYIPIYPTGVAATDTAAAIAALASASSTRQPIEVQRNGNILRLNQGMAVPSNVRWIGNGVTHEVQVGTGGFNSTNRSDKLNQNAQNTCLFMIGNASGTLERENVGFHDIVFSASAASERIIQLIVACEGFDTTQLRLTDMYAKDIKTGAALFAVSSLGNGSAWIENISARDCTIAGTTWTGTPNTTVIEVDTDLTDGGSKPGVIKGIRGKSLSMTGSALSTYSDQSDLVTLGNVLLATKSAAWQVSDLYADGVGEVIDCMANGATISNVRGENVMFVLKFIHGARYCAATNISGRSISNALITFAGTSAAGSGDTLQNVVSNATCETFSANEAVGVLIQENVGTTGLPKKNTVMGLRMLGDSNGDWYVKDNCTTDNDNDNRVYLMDGSAAGTASVSILHGENTRIHSTNRGIAQISLGANQTLTTLATLDFSVATYDPEGIAVTASDKVTVKLPGLYMVKIALRFASDLDDGNGIDIRCVGGGVTQSYNYTAGAGGKQDVVTGVFHVHIKEEHIGSSTADIYAQAALNGAGDCTILTTVGYTGMWLTRIG